MGLPNSAPKFLSTKLMQFSSMRQKLCWSLWLIAPTHMEQSVFDISFSYTWIFQSSFLLGWINQWWQYSPQIFWCQTIRSHPNCKGTWSFEMWILNIWGLCSFDISVEEWYWKRGCWNHITRYFRHFSSHQFNGSGFDGRFWKFREINYDENLHGLFFCAYPYHWPSNYVSLHWENEKTWQQGAWSSLRRVWINWCGNFWRLLSHDVLTKISWNQIFH